MIYPGATPLLNTMIGPMVKTERNKLLYSGAQRAKIQSSLGNNIDTLFFDRRPQVNEQHGSTLIITSKYENKIFLFLKCSLIYYH